MQRLRGSFSATPIEKANLRPYLNLHIARQKGRLRRIVRKGLAPPGDKPSLRAAAEQAAQVHAIRRFPAGMTGRTPRQAE